MKTQTSFVPSPPKTVSFSKMEPAKLYRSTEAAFSDSLYFKLEDKLMFANNDIAGGVGFSTRILHYDTFIEAAPGTSFTVTQV